MSFVTIFRKDEYEAYTNFASFPTTGKTDTTYLNQATGEVYEWNGTAYEKIGSSIIDVDDLVTLTGLAANAKDFGTFTGTLIGDNLTLKPILQALELSTQSNINSTLASGGILVGNASNVATAVTPSGDVTMTNGGVFTLGNTGVTAGTYGDANTLVQFTVDAKGRITGTTEVDIDHDALTNFVANEHIDHSSVSVGTANDSGLAGGGDLTATRNLSVDIDGTTDLGATPDGADFIMLWDSSAGVLRKVSITNFNSSNVGKLDYQGTWDATANTPALADGVGTKGHYYVVGTAGATNIDGITDWKVGDWIVFNGTVWEKADHTDQVSSVFGRTGAVVAVAGDYNALQITYDNTTSGLVAVTTQAAIDELQAIFDQINPQVTVTGHGFVAGQAIYFDGTDWLSGLADDGATVATAVVGSVVDANTFTLAKNGQIVTVVPAPLQGTAVTLASGDFMYVSDTEAGKYVTTRPTISNLMGQMVSATQMMVQGVTAFSGGSGSGGGGGGGVAATTFAALTDTPASLAGQGGKVVVVNAAGNALEFLTEVRDRQTGITGSVVTLPSVPTVGQPVDVMLNGQVMDLTGDYTISGDTITFLAPFAPLIASDIIKTNYRTS